MARRTVILVTKHQRNELTKLDGAEYWERLADITEHPVEYLKGLERPITMEVVQPGSERDGDGGGVMMVYGSAEGWHDKAASLQRP